MFDHLWGENLDIDPDEFTVDDTEEGRIIDAVEYELSQASEGLYTRPNVTFMDGWDL